MKKHKKMIERRKNTNEDYLKIQYTLNGKEKNRDDKRQMRSIRKWEL